MHSVPVVDATLPSAPTTPTWRSAAIGSSACAVARASLAVFPLASASRHRGPYAGSPIACVATAPTPARTHGTIDPTANIAVWTATPNSPVARSRATIEYATDPPPEPSPHLDRTAP